MKNIKGLQCKFNLNQLKFNEYSLFIYLFYSTNKYLLKLELEYSIPECQLYLVGLRRGILGHPKCLYDTMLNLNENSLRKMELSDANDPYGLLKQSSIEIHTSNASNVERFEDTFYQNKSLTSIYEYFHRHKNMSRRFIINREKSGGIEMQKKIWKHKESIIRRMLKFSIESV